MKAMILAAGFGKRLGTLTSNKPKCLIDVAGRPMIEYVIQRILDAGITSIAINTHYLAEQVEEYIATAEILKNVDVKVFRENEILGTGGGLKNAQTFLQDDTDGAFIVHNADIYEEFDLKALCDNHLESNSLATLAVLDKRTVSCVVVNSAGEYQGLWNGSSELSAGLTPYTYSGVQCVSTKVFDYMRDFTNEFAIFPVYNAALDAGEKISTFYQGGRYFIDMGTPSDLESLRQKLTVD